MGTHHSEGSFGRKGGNLLMGLCDQISSPLFPSNCINFFIIPCPGYGSLVVYWFYHVNHILLGLYNFPLQLWVFPGTLSDNNFIYKLITGGYSVYFPPTDLALFLTCQTMYWARVILRIIILKPMDTLECMLCIVYMYIILPYFTSFT